MVAEETGERRRIVASKLRAPPLRPGIVDRPKLVDDLVSSSHASVALISAPAGYGKTTLLTLWREREERPFCWVSLEPADNDAVGLVAAVIAALEPIVDVGLEVRQGLNAPDPALEDFILPSIVEACAAEGQALVLVLDDLHFVSDRRGHDAIGYLAERLPTGCQLALATRVDPPLPLASLRAHGRLVEVRVAELALGDHEAAALLAAADVHLTEERVTQLRTRTEGWAAAMYLAALSLRDRSNPDEFVSRFAGTSRHVAEFLSEDVLARQPDHVIGFLLHTCVLDELTPSLCTALTGAADAGETVRQLERDNLFVVPLDEDGLTYRYHHLFAQYLRAELARREPELLPELHRRAWQWYREHGLTGRAVAHAQASGDIDVAADLVSAEWLPMVEGGQVETMRSWMAGFDDAQILGHAPLAIAAAWVAANAGDGGQAARFAEAAQQGRWDGPMPDGTASLDSALAIMSSAFGLGGVSKMRAAAALAFELEPPTSRWRPLVSLLLGLALTLDDDFGAAREVLEAAAHLSDGETSTGAFALAHLAVIGLREGDDEQALAHVQRALPFVQRPGLRNYMPSVATYAVAANLLCRRRDLDGTEDALERALALLPRVTDAYWWLMIEARILLAPVFVALGRRSEAESQLDEAAALLAVHDDCGGLRAWCDDVARTVRSARRQRPPSHELSEAEERILRLLSTTLTLREIGAELYLSLNTVKTHTLSIYRKLGVSSRAEAVRAVRTGR